MQQTSFSQGQSSMVDPRYQDYPVHSSLLNVCFSVPSIVRVEIY